MVCWGGLLLKGQWKALGAAQSGKSHITSSKISPFMHMFRAKAGTNKEASQEGDDRTGRRSSPVLGWHRSVLWCPIYTSNLFQTPKHWGERGKGFLLSGMYQSRFALHLKRLPVVEVDKGLPHENKEISREKDYT